MPTEWLNYIIICIHTILCHLKYLIHCSEKLTYFASTGHPKKKLSYTTVCPPMAILTNKKYSSTPLYSNVAFDCPYDAVITVLLIHHTTEITLLIAV